MFRERVDMTSKVLIKKAPCNFLIPIYICSSMYRILGGCEFPDRAPLYEGAQVTEYLFLCLYGHSRNAIQNFSMIFLT